MLHTVSWIAAHRFLFADLRQHLLGWPDRLVPHGRRVTYARPPPRPPERSPHTICHSAARPFALRSNPRRNTATRMPDHKPEIIALFRYGLIAPLVLETLPRGEFTRRAQEIAARLYDIPHSTRRQVSVDTLLDWTLRYRRHGLPAFMPQPRQDRGHMRAIPDATAALIERLKRENPYRTGTALLNHLALSGDQAEISLSTLYRFLRSRGLTAEATAPGAGRRQRPQKV